MMIRLVLRLGLLRSTALSSLVSILMSVALTVLIFSWFNLPFLGFGILAAILCPTLIATPLSYFTFKGLDDLIKTQMELNKANVSLELMVKEVKELTGLLPICAYCKKIRDDHGYWNQIESFISRHSQAKFSHGICPDCASSLMRDLNQSR